MQTLRKFKNFIDEISADNSRLYKISVIEKYKNDEDIKYLLNFAVDPYVITGISDKKLNKNLSAPAREYNIYQICEYLKEHNTGRDIDITFVKSFRNFLPEDLHEIYDNIITKNIKCGIDAKTINKVIPGLISGFEVMLANKYFDKPEIVEGKEFALTTKIDGMRCVMIKENNKISFWSRQGQPIEGLVDLEAEAQNFAADNFVLDGELVAISNSPDTYKQTMKLARTKEVEKHGLRMMVFDYLPLREFKAQISTQIYSERRQILNNLFNKNFTYYTLLPILYQGNDTSKITEILDTQVNAGEEGIMVNILDAVYSYSRSNALLKCKKFQDTELKIIGFEEGINKLQNSLGAVLCEYKNNIVKCGSGFSEELREEIWNNQEKYLNKIITVKYFEETYDSKTKKPSLRFPIFMRFREDL